MAFTKKEKAILWRWPLVMFIVIGITFLINYVCGGSFMDRVQKVDVLWWNIPLANFLSYGLTGWWSNILFAPLVYFVSILFLTHFDKYMEKILLVFLTVGMFCLYVPFGRSIVLVLPIFLSFLLSFLSMLDEEKRIDVSEDTQRFLVFFAFSSSLSVCLFYPFGIVFLIFILDIISVILGITLAFFLNKCVSAIYFVPKSGGKFAGWTKWIITWTVAWVSLKDVPEDE